MPAWDRSTNIAASSPTSRWTGVPGSVTVADYRGRHVGGVTARSGQRRLQEPGQPPVVGGVGVSGIAAVALGRDGVVPADLGSVEARLDADDADADVPCAQLQVQLLAPTPADRPTASAQRPYQEPATADCGPGARPPSESLTDRPRRLGPAAGRAPVVTYQFAPWRPEFEVRGFPTGPSSRRHQRTPWRPPTAPQPADVAVHGPRPLDPASAAPVAEGHRDTRR